MKQFYRLQNQFHEGPYRHQEANRILKSHWGDDEWVGRTHPSPYDDSLLCERVLASGRDGYWDGDGSYMPWIHYHVFHYGFDSVKQFFRWFYDAYMLIELDEIGFKLYVYEVNEMYIGNTQAIIPSREFVEIKHQPKDALNLIELYDQAVSLGDSPA
jgi:hypothetical protein